MDVALAVAVTDGSAELVMTGAADGQRMDQSVIDLSANPNPHDELVATIAGTDQALSSGGHRLVATQVDWADPARAAALRDALLAAGIQGVTVKAGADYSSYHPTTTAVTEDLAQTGISPQQGSHLAYSQVDPDSGSLAYGNPQPAAAEPDVPLQTPLAPLVAHDETDAPIGGAPRPRSLLIGSTMAGLAVILIAATSVTVAMSVRPAAAQQIFADNPDYIPPTFVTAVGPVPDNKGDMVISNPPPPPPLPPGPVAVEGESNPGSHEGVIYGGTGTTTPPAGFDPNQDYSRQDYSRPPVTGDQQQTDPGTFNPDFNAGPPPVDPNASLFAGLAIVQAAAQVVQVGGQLMIPILNQQIAPPVPQQRQQSQDHQCSPHHTGTTGRCSPDKGGDGRPPVNSDSDGGTPAQTKPIDGQNPSIETDGPVTTNPSTSQQSVSSTTSTSQQSVSSTTSQTPVTTTTTTTQTPMTTTTTTTQAPVTTTTTRAPEVIHTPETTQAPVVTYTPETTQAPVVIHTPEPTQAPVVIHTPEPTQAPVVIHTPEPTQAPVVTYTPEPAPPPVVVHTPESTQAPVIPRSPSGSGASGIDTSGSGSTRTGSGSTPTTTALMFPSLHG